MDFFGAMTFGFISAEACKISEAVYRELSFIILVYSGIYSELESP
jgi:hypothetical protein